MRKLIIMACFLSSCSRNNDVPFAATYTSSMGIAGKAADLAACFAQIDDAQAASKQLKNRVDSVNRMYRDNYSEYTGEAASSIAMMQSTDVQNAGYGPTHRAQASLRRVAQVCRVAQQTIQSLAIADDLSEDDQGVLRTCDGRVGKIIGFAGQDYDGSTWADVELVPCREIIERIVNANGGWPSPNLTQGVTSNGSTIQSAVPTSKPELDATAKPEYAAVPKAVEANPPIVQPGSIEPLPVYTFQQGADQAMPCQDGLDLKEINPVMPCPSRADSESERAPRRFAPN